MNTTTRLPRICPDCLTAFSMRDLVHGHVCQPATTSKRRRAPGARLVFIVAFASMVYGCATARPVTTPEVETVGTLSASYNSIAVAPVHASTDFGHAEIVESAGDDASNEVTTTTRMDAGGDAELPEVVGKTDGVTVGGAR